MTHNDFVGINGGTPKFVSADMVGRLPSINFCGDRI